MKADDKDRNARLAEQLRANLRRRKAQARAATDKAECVPAADSGASEKSG